MAKSKYSWTDEAAPPGGAERRALVAKAKAAARPQPKIVRRPKYTWATRTTSSRPSGLRSCAESSAISGMREQLELRRDRPHPGRSHPFKGSTDDCLPAGFDKSYINCST